MLKFYNEEGLAATADQTREMIKRYEMFVQHFGDSLLCSTNVPKFSGKRILAKQPSGRVSLRKLRPAYGGASKIKVRRFSDVKPEPNFFLETKMESDDMLDYYSNSSRQDFNLLADMGLPSDIFEPEDRYYCY